MTAILAFAGVFAALTRHSPSISRFRGAQKGSSLQNFGVAVKQTKRRGMISIENHQRGKFAGSGGGVQHLAAAARLGGGGGVGAAEVPAPLPREGGAEGGCGEGHAAVWGPI